MQVDYIIIGQGLCGTFLSYHLLKAGKTCLVIDAPQLLTASKAASGIINPVTGRRIVKTWMIDELLPFCWDAYKQLGEVINESLISECSVLDFHPTPQMRDAFTERALEDKDYLRTPGVEEWQSYFRFNYGIGEVNRSLLIEVNLLLNGWRKQLQQKQLLLEETFSWDNCVVTPGEINYKNIRAEKIICCEGVAGFDNPWFNMLPYVRNKGEVIIASIPGLPRNHIYKQGISLVPWQEDKWWIGSTYEWQYNDLLPSAGFRKKVVEQLDYLLKPGYTILDHWSAERPTNMERRPFVGFHPVMPSVGVLNGMGTKGCSLAPFFAAQLTGYLTKNTAIEPLADVKRFTRILSINS